VNDDDWHANDEQAVAPMNGTRHTSVSAGKPFKSPKRTLGDIDANVAASIISATADIALVIDRKGVIRDLACDSEDLARRWCHDWIGKHWIDTVTVESRRKVEEVLREAAEQMKPRWRQVNHPALDGADLPVQYVAVGLGAEGRVVAVGRELTTVASLQQRLVQAQQSLEQEYQKLRNVETRYRALFHLSSEAIVIVDGANLKVVEANPAAVRMLANGARRVVGRSLLELIGRQSLAAVQSLLQSVLTSVREETATVVAAVTGRSHTLSASLFRQEGNAYYLVRLLPAAAEQAGANGWRSKANVLEVVERLPEAFVVTDLAGHILTANSAFIDLVQLASEAQAKGQSIDRWLGRVEVDVAVLIANLREHGSVKRYRTVSRGAFGTNADIEVSAVHVPQSQPPCLGFSIRVVETAARQDEDEDGLGLPQSADQLSGLVGRKPLKEIVRQTSDIIEKLCIEAALELTGDNRASAAEMLGLSRQSLYVKMRHLDLE
jgi:transcriptional regulator PpsR